MSGANHSRRAPRREFTEAEDAYLIEAVRLGITRVEIAQALGRQRDTIMSRMALLKARGVALPAGDPANRRGRLPQGSASLATLRAVAKASRRQPRACLCCGRSFSSEGPHNRLCIRCGSKSLSCYDSPASVLR